MSPHHWSIADPITNTARRESELLPRITKMWHRDTRWANAIAKMVPVHLLDVRLPQAFHLRKQNKQTKVKKPSIPWGTIKRVQSNRVCLWWTPNYKPNRTLLSFIVPTLQNKRLSPKRITSPRAKGEPSTREAPTARCAINNKIACTWPGHVKPSTSTPQTVTG